MMTRMPAHISDQPEVMMEVTSNWSSVTTVQSRATFIAITIFFSCQECCFAPNWVYIYIQKWQAKHVHFSQSQFDKWILSMGNVILIYQFLKIDF